MVCNMETHFSSSLWKTKLAGIYKSAAVSLQTPSPQPSYTPLHPQTGEFTISPSSCNLQVSSLDGHSQSKHPYSPPNSPLLTRRSLTKSLGKRHVTNIIENKRCVNTGIGLRQPEFIFKLGKLHTQNWSNSCTAILSLKNLLFFPLLPRNIQ